MSICAGASQVWIKEYKSNLTFVKSLYLKRDVLGLKEIFGYQRITFAVKQYCVNITVVGKSFAIMHRMTTFIITKLNK